MSDPVAGTPVRTPTPKGPSGEELVRAFNEVRTELVSMLFFFLGNYEDAQDTVQDAFLKCWRGRNELHGVQDLKAWIFRVGINAAKDLQRNAWRQRARPLPCAASLVVAHGDSPVRAAEEREAQERLRQAILGLRPDEKEVYLLRQNACLTYEEIAQLRRAPVGTVKTQMRAAISKLRRVLQEK